MTEDCIVCDDARSFLEALAKDGSLTFQTFDEGKAKSPRLSQIFHGSLEKHQVNLQKLNEQGAGVFVMVNRGDLKGRKRNNVIEVRALFVDLDGAPIDPVKNATLPPHIIVQSSPGKFHAYWIVKGVELDQFTNLQQSLAHKFSGDPAVSDLSRVMRLPGFYHNKDSPFLTSILEVNSREMYEIEEFCRVLDISEVAEKWDSADSIIEGARNDTLFKMASSYSKKGFDADEIYKRISKTNISRCKPPLEDAELRTILTNASRYGPQGSVVVPYAVYDSPKFKSLNHKAVALYLYAMRRSQNSPCTEISLAASETSAIGLGNPGTLSKTIEELLRSGFLIKVRQSRYGQRGGVRQCALYTVT